jgi:hypothetical protein
VDDARRRGSDGGQVGWSSTVHAGDSLEHDDVHGVRPLSASGIEDQAEPLPPSSVGVEPVPQDDG